MRRFLTAAAPWLPYALAVLLILGVWIAYREHDARVRADAALAVVTAQHRAALDSATALAAHRDTVFKRDSVRVVSRVTRYDTLRARVPVFDTARTVVVDTEFVVAADSVRRACTAFVESCAARHAADSTRYVALERLTADYKQAAGVGVARRVRVRPALAVVVGLDGRIVPGVGLSLTWGR